MRTLITLLLAALGFAWAAASHAAPVDIGAGVEMFNWQEFDASGSVTLKESGPRLFLHFEADNQVSERWTYGFRSRLYSGSAACSGTLKDGSSCLVDSEYDGLMARVDFTGRFRRSGGDFSDWGLRFGVGGETWRRQYAGAAGYSEDFSVISGRLGVALAPAQGWFGEGGLKYPFAVNEKLTLNDGVSLKPQGAFSLFATVGYNFSQRWSLRGYYDSYRFNASDPEPLTAGGVAVGSVAQARSDNHVAGLAAGFYF